MCGQLGEQGVNDRAKERKGNKLPFGYNKASNLELKEERKVFIEFCIM